MLTQLHRHGPLRQRVWRGFAVAVEGARWRAVSTAAIQQQPVAALGLRVRLDPFRHQRPAVWLDSGLTWLHTEDARADFARRVTDATRVLFSWFGERGATLVPNAVRQNPRLPWRQSLVGDRHILEVSDESEKEILCNLIRSHLPTLVALSARAGVDGTAVEPGSGSRRLLESTRHYPARYLDSGDPGYLVCFAESLRRDEGIARLELLDINPLGLVTEDDPADDRPATVELRFPDGALMPAVVRAQALLYQALAIRARRMAKRGWRVLPDDQALFERNRSRAVAHGLDARFESPATPDRGRLELGARSSVRTARAAAFDLLTDLTYELQILNADFAEIAPLVLGTALRRIGLGAVESENDLLRLSATHTPPRSPARDALEFACKHIDRVDLMTQRNLATFPEVAAVIEASWTAALSGDIAPRLRPPQGDELGERFPEAAPPRLTRAARGFLTALRDLPKNPPLRSCVQPLLDFRVSAGHGDLAAALKNIASPDAEFIYRTLRPAARDDGHLRERTALWDDRGPRWALENAAKHGVALLRGFVPTGQGGELWDWLRDLEKETPQGYWLILLSAGQDMSQRKDLSAELLVVKVPKGNRR